MFTFGTQHVYLPCSEPPSPNDQWLAVRKRAREYYFHSSDLMYNRVSTVFMCRF